MLIAEAPDWLDLESEATNVPTDDKIKAIADLVADQLRLEAELQAAKGDVKRLEQELAKVQKIELPLAMQAAGTKSFELNDGTLVKIKPECYASISDNNEFDAFEWLEQTGNEGIIKNEIKIPFGKGQNEIAAQLLQELRARYAEVQAKRTVHASTLKSFAREQLAKESDPTYKGPKIPRQTFGVYEETIAKIDLKKVKRQG